MDTTSSLKVKRESFSTFNKNVFSFEAVEVLGHIFGGVNPPDPSNMSANAWLNSGCAENIHPQSLTSI